VHSNVIQLGHQRFVCGLFWQSLSRRHELRAEAVELARKLRFDLMVLRSDRGVEAAGFANTRDGFQSGSLSLGAMVARAIALEGAVYDGRRQPAPNWLGAFSLPDGRWAYFAVRHHAFMPNGDCVGTRDEVFERLRSDYAWGGWNVVIGDDEIESLGFHNFYPKRIEALLPRRRGRARTERWWGLRPVERRVTLRAAALAAGAVSVLAGGTLAYWHHERKLEDQARQLSFERARAQLLKHGAAAPAIKHTDANHPWAAEPEALSFATACAARFKELSPGGWRLARYDCTGSAAHYAWSRGDSTVRYLLDEAPTATIDANGEHATLDAPLRVRAGGDDALGDDTPIRAQLLTQIQTLGVVAKLELQSAAGLSRTSLSAVDTPAVAARDWHAYRLSADLGGLSPIDFVRIIDCPGLRVHNIVYQNGQWSIEGVVYAK